MAKIKLKSGDIFQISLPKELGFAYGKYIDLHEINPDYQYPSLVRVFNFKTVHSGINIQELKRCDLLFSPLLVAGIMPAVKEGTWTIIGNLPLTPAEKIIPHYKLNEETNEWFYVKDADKFSKRVKSKYENVKHLETLSATGSSLLPTKIAMALLLLEEKKIEDYFELEEYFEKEYYKEVTTIPPYCKLPDSLRGKAIE
jgi:hypothetical protein